MSEGEGLVLIGSLLGTAVGWKNWYTVLFTAWPLNRGVLKRIFFGLLPPVCTLIIYYVLRNLASFDVVNDLNYVIFYILFGLAWLAGGKVLFFIMYDLSWRDDVIEGNNAAAFFAVSGGLLGLTAIYSGANIGDGPGWWCVLFAGGLAVVTWFLLLETLDVFSKIFERITIDRDIPTGIRIGFFMLASGLVLGRGAAGDWTSSTQTVIEFLDAWPVLFLTLGAIFIERRYSQQVSYKDDSTNGIFGALLCGVIYLILAVLILQIFPPMPENPIYSLIRTLGVG